MNIKQNLFASLGRKGIIATTTGLIAVGGVCLTIDKITKQDSKKNKEETSVVKDTINKFKSYDISNDNFISVEGEGNNEQINVAILPVLEKSISVSTNVDFESSIAAGTPLDELMKEESSSLELAIIKKSKELEETKKKYEAAEEKYKSALERAKLISGDLSIDEYISKTKDELDAAKVNYQNAVTECEKLLKIYDDEHTLATNAANSLKNSLVLKANSEYEESIKPYIAKYEAAIADAKKNQEERNLILKEKYEKELASIGAVHEKTLNNINQTYSNNALALKTIKEEKLSKILSDYETAVDKAKKAYEIAIQKNEEQYNAEVAIAQEKFDSDTSEEQKKLDKAIEEALRTYDEALLYIENSEEYQKLKKAKELAQSEYNAALLNKDAIKNTLADAQKAYDDVLKQQEIAKTELDKAQKEAEQAKNSLEDVNKQVILLKNRIAEEGENNESFKNELNNAVTELEEKRLAVEATNRKLEELISNLNVATDKIEDAKLKVEEAQSALAEADEEIASGALGFYRSQYDVNEYGEKVCSSDVARAIAMINYYSSESIPEEIRTVLGDSNDATSLENMKKSLEILKEGNELRINDENFECGDWLITNKAMANAQVSANAENIINGHWSRDAEYSYLHPSNTNKTEWGTNAENAAWGWEDPYDGWYKEEKTYYDFRKEYKASNPSATEEEIVNAAKQEGKYAYISGGTTGHYVAMENKYLVYTGLAVNSEDGFNNYAQEFDKTTNSNALKQDSKAYTIEEYYSMFMSYYNGVYAKKEAARNALEKAQANLDSIQANGGMSEEDRELLNKAKAEVADAQAEYNSAKQALDNAGTNLTLSNEKINSLNAELEDVLEEKVLTDAALKSKESDLGEYADDFNKVTADVEEKKAELDKSNSDYAEAGKKVEIAESKLADAETKLNDAEADNESDKVNALKNKEEAIADAYDEYALNTQKAGDKLAEAIAEAKNNLAIKNEEAEGSYDKAITEAENVFEEETVNASNQYENEAQSLKLKKDDDVAKADAVAIEGQSDAENSYVTGLTQSQKTYEDELIDAENELSKAKDMLESQKEDAIAQATEDCSKAIAEADAKLEQNTSQIESLLANAESWLNAAQSTYDSAVDVAEETETAENKLEAAVNELTDAQNALDALVNGDGTASATLVVEADGSATLYISEASE